MVEPPAAFAFAEGWSQKEVAAFHTGIKEHGKLFNKIRVRDAPCARGARTADV